MIKQGVWLFVSERKQIALFRHERLFEVSRAVLRDKSLRNEGYHGKAKKTNVYVRYVLK